MNIRRGMSKTDAFKNAGISVDVGFSWLKNGRDETGDPVFVRFERIVERAVAQYNGKMVDMVTSAAMSGSPNTWQAAMTLLERRDPGNWGRRDALKIEAETPLIQLNQVVLVDEQARELSRDLLRRVAGPGASIALGTGVRGELTDGD